MMLCLEYCAFPFSYDHILMPYISKILCSIVIIVYVVVYLVHSAHSWTRRCILYCVGESQIYLRHCSGATFTFSHQQSIRQSPGSCSPQLGCPVASCLVICSLCE